MEAFYRRFGEELSDVERGNEAYRRYCQGVGLRTLSFLFTKHCSSLTNLQERAECPELPKEVKIDGKEVRFSFSCSLFSRRRGSQQLI
jgi:hypothetical protein